MASIGFVEELGSREGTALAVPPRALTTGALAPEGAKS